MNNKAFACLACLVSLIAVPTVAAPALKALDTDKDGRVDVAEAKAAGETVFQRLDRDKTGDLTKKELQGRISKKDWSAADPDNDGTISKDEYLATVDSALNKADTDHDGTLDSQELMSRDGQAFLRLVR